MPAPSRHPVRTRSASPLGESSPPPRSERPLGKLPRGMPPLGRSLLPALLLAALALALLVGCGAPAAPASPPRLADLAPGVWNAVPLAGGTVCADGSPYRMFVRPGDPARLLLHFQGGGACWGPLTCALPFDAQGDGFYRARLDGGPDALPQAGIFDPHEPGNPFRGWTHALVAYCTGDVHLGDTRARYPRRLQPDLRIEHRGAVNARAALAWLAAERLTPERVMVLGCSAGAYGAVAWTPTVRGMYPEATMALLGDSGVGVLGDAFFAPTPTDDDAGIRRWNLDAALRDNVAPDFGDPYTPELLPRLYEEVLRLHPELPLGQYSSYRDAVQTLFYALTGGSGGPPFGLPYDAWSRRALATLDALEEAAAPAGDDGGGFSSYWSRLDDDDTPANGSAHCILPDDALYELRVGGERFVDWLATLASGRLPPTVRPPEVAARAAP